MMSLIFTAAPGDPEQLRLTPRGCLARYEAQPGREITAAVEHACVTDCRHQGGRVQHADARDSGQTASRRIIARHLGKLVVEGRDPLVERAPLVEHVVEQTPHAWPDSVVLRPGG